MSETIKPTGVKADRTARVVTISWSDGATCDYPFAGLRAVCPCVACRGGHENMGRPADKETLRTAQNPDLTLENIQAVGSYAIQFFWSDGHDTGIYTWKYLRDACLEDSDED